MHRHQHSNRNGGDDWYPEDPYRQRRKRRKRHSSRAREIKPEFDDDFDLSFEDSDEYFDPAAVDHWIDEDPEESL